MSEIQSNLPATTFHMDNLAKGIGDAAKGLNTAGTKLTEEGVSNDPAKLLNAQLEMNKATAAFTAQTSMVSTMGNLSKEMARNLNIH